MQLVAPVRVVVVLEHESLRDGSGQGYLAAVLAQGTAQGTDRVVVLAPCHVVPPLDGDGREMDIASGHRMRPGLLRQGRGWLSSAHRAGGELRSEPTTENRNRAHKAPVELGFVGVITFPRKTR